MKPRKIWWTLIVIMPIYGASISKDHVEGLITGFYLGGILAAITFGVEKTIKYLRRKRS